MTEAGLARKLPTASSLVPPTLRSKLLLNHKYWTARQRVSIIAGAGRRDTRSSSSSRGKDALGFAQMRRH